ncbi:MAG: CPBP family intramembrane metalloprotease [Oscillospiraceae bacterium]|nr:CPBP family intramembrane metalloprotease [Oscillospiraceae bacterium]
MRAKIFPAAKAIVFCAIYVFVYIAMQFLWAIVLALLALGSGDYSTAVMGNLFSCMVFAMAASLGIYSFMSLLREKPMFDRFITIRPISSATVIDAILAALALRGIVAAYTVFSENVPILKESIENAPDTMAALDSAPKILLALTVVTVFGPIFEEFLFRGLVQSELCAVFPTGFSIFISALVFGASHGLLFQSIFTFFCGLVMGWCFYRTGSMFTSIIVHIAFNSSALLQFAAYILPWPLLIVLVILSLILLRYALRGIAQEYPRPAIQ